MDQLQRAQSDSYDTVTRLPTSTAHASRRKPFSYVRSTDCLELADWEDVWMFESLKRVTAVRPDREPFTMLRLELPKIQPLDGNRCADVQKGLGLRALSSFRIDKTKSSGRRSKSRSIVDGQILQLWIKRRSSESSDLKGW